MNPFARLHLARRFLEFLPQCSPFYTGAIEPLIRRIDRVLQTRPGNWRLPTEEVEFADEPPEIERYFAEWNPAALQAAATLQKQLYTKALERGLSPGGIIRNDDKDSGYVHWFADARNNRELWLFLPDESLSRIDKILALERESLSTAGCLPETIASVVPHGTVFFTPFDGQSTARLSKEALKTFEINPSLPIHWPSSWPANCRENTAGQP